MSLNYVFSHQYKHSNPNCDYYHKDSGVIIEEVHVKKHLSS